MADQKTMDNTEDENSLSQPKEKDSSAQKLCSLTEKLDIRKARRRPRPPRRTPQQAQMVAGQKIVRKYRRFARNLEYQRLKSIVPNVAKKDWVSRAEILQEAINYIDTLHSRLVQSIKVNGIPKSMTSKNEEGSTSSDRPDPARSRLVPTRTSQDLCPNQIIEMVQSSLRPDIERRLQARRDLDQAVLDGIVKITEAISVMTSTITHSSTVTSNATTSVVNRLEMDLSDSPDEKRKDI